MPQKKVGSFFGVGCIFDKDGTLIDTERIWFEAYKRLLEPLQRRHDVETHRLMMGASADVCMSLLRQKHPDVAVTKEQLFRKFREIRDEWGVCPKPGATRLLEALARIGIPMAMATSARREEAMQDLDVMNWKRHFIAVVAAEDVRHHKPAPEVYLEAAARMHLDPKCCVAFEDGVNGAMSALTAGMRVVFVRDDRFGVTPPSGVHVVVNSLEGLVLTS